MSWAMSRPSMYASPDVALRNPMSMLIVVVFPAPLGPSSPKTSPLSTARLRFRTATFSGTPSAAGNTFLKSRRMMECRAASSSVMFSTRWRSAATSSVSSTISMLWMLLSPRGGTVEDPGSPLPCFAISNSLLDIRMGDWCFFGFRIYSRKNKGWRLTPDPLAITYCTHSL